MTSPLELLKPYIQKCHECYVKDDGDLLYLRTDESHALQRKQKQMKERKAEIVKNIVDGQVISEHSYLSRTLIDYLIVLQHVVKQREYMYLEEQLQHRRAIFEDGEMIDDYLVNHDGLYLPPEDEIRTFDSRSLRQRPNYHYDRLAVVKYAERWWNDYNPEYRKFEDDCTNYVSQCMRAGGAPKTGVPNRSKGWWYQNNNWSFSWTVAHSLRWYLSGDNSGLQAREVASPEQLMKGDVICYDFNGNGRWQHTTIVVAHDADGMPLVNAHTTNSRMRYWAYEDSTAWTPQIQYKFFNIIDRNS
ncbi:amidase domain-containing protein [Bacillus shivajii]|uniref:amidase domain-containing protein n=1 Tax=Bacillus shivajii TaxID=1983719 RepID=UPI001CFB51B4|nr:amidase domain-containing protein [Bacillus shivajii]UCZ54149.1 amidase domain-containing protein [Bacillus shivajii]